VLDVQVIGVPDVKYGEEIRSRRQVRRGDHGLDPAAAGRVGADRR
jgi:hypothetical protein